MDMLPNPELARSSVKMAVVCFSAETQTQNGYRCRIIDGIEGSHEKMVVIHLLPIE
jgi:hypothetical protein